MKFALVDGHRHEAQPHLSGECQTCGRPMVARCGEINIWHWAHLGSRLCDTWWENETEWHRAWKGLFPVDWQEVVHHAESGERHIADVKTDRGWVFEFQHSYLKPEERRARGAFYRKLIWVVDATRRKRDREQLQNAWNEGVRVGANSFVRRVFSDNCALLREWAGGGAPVFFDVGDSQVLVWFLANGSDGAAYVAVYPRAQLIESHRAGATTMARDFDDFARDIPKLIADLELNRRLLAAQQPSLPNQTFQRYLIRRARSSRRL